MFIFTAFIPSCRFMMQLNYSMHSVHRSALLFSLRPLGSDSFHCSWTPASLLLALHLHPLWEQECSTQNMNIILWRTLLLVTCVCSDICKQLQFLLLCKGPELSFQSAPHILKGSLDLMSQSCLREKTEDCFVFLQEHHEKTQNLIFQREQTLKIFFNWV